MSGVIMTIRYLWVAAQGYRTYLASAAAILSALAGVAGVLPSATAQGLAVAFGGLGAIALRVSQENHALTLAEALQALKDAQDVIQEAKAKASPSGPSGVASTALLLAASLVIAGAGGSAFAQDRPTVKSQMNLAAETRGWFANPDGSCVQCSIGMAGVHCNDPAASTLLWDSAYGPAVRGGSNPSRVEGYCDSRGIKAWSVTGRTVDDTMPWMAWAARTGRFAAIGAGAQHFQTLYGYDPTAAKPWMLCNNNSTSRIDRYDDRELRWLHASSGPWVVILEKPSSDPPRLVRWWK